MKTFTIISTRDQKKYVINTEATTMAELTADMRKAGIDYNNMTLYEGLTKSEFNPANSDAILPHDVPYKGTTTSNLVFRLTVSQKKIESGMDYKEMKSFIKDNKLQLSFKEIYDKDYTHATKDELQEFVDSYEYLQVVPAGEECKVPTETNPYEDTVKQLLVDLRQMSATLTGKLDALLIALNEGGSDFDLDTKEEEPQLPSPYSNEEIDDMFD